MCVACCKKGKGTVSPVPVGRGPAVQNTIYERTVAHNDEFHV